MYKTNINEPKNKSPKIITQIWTAYHADHYLKEGVENIHYKIFHQSLLIPMHKMIHNEIIMITLPFHYKNDIHINTRWSFDPYGLICFKLSDLINDYFYYLMPFIDENWKYLQIEVQQYINNLGRKCLNHGYEIGDYIAVIEHPWLYQVYECWNHGYLPNDDNNEAQVVRVQAVAIEFDGIFCIFYIFYVCFIINQNKTQI